MTFQVLTGRVHFTWLPQVSLDEYADGKDRQRDRWTVARPLHYAFRWTRRIINKIHSVLRVVASFALLSSVNREMCSRIDMQTHDRRLALGFDLLTSGSVHAEVLPWTICLPTLVLITPGIFVLERGQTGKQTDATSGVTTRGAVRQLPQGAWRRGAP